MEFWATPVQCDLILVISARVLFPNKVTFTGSEGHYRVQYKLNSGGVQRLMPVDPALWEAKAG